MWPIPVKIQVSKKRLRVLTGLMALVYLAAYPPARAEVMFNDSRIWRRARLVSAGQQVWSFQTSYQKTNARFGTSGQVEPLGARYSRAVTWGQLLNAEASEQGRADMKSYMRSRGAKENDVAATSTYDLEREDLGLSVDWAYGLTRRWMIGFQVPLMLRRTKVSTQVEMTPALAQGVGAAGQKSLLAMDHRQVRDKVKTLAEQGLANSGYDDIPDESKSWEWGDVSLLSQFYLANGYRWQWALQQLVRFPTSQNPSTSDYLQVASDDGQVDLGLTSLANFRVRRWTLGSRLGYVAQLPDSVRMHMGDDKIDPNVHRDLGDWIWASLDADYRLTYRWGLDFEQSYLSKGRDRYKGGSITSTGTDQQVHQTRLGVVYEIGDTTSRRGIDRKWLASVGYTQPWVGHNTADAGKAGLEFTSYF